MQVVQEYKVVNNEYRKDSDYCKRVTPMLPQQERPQGNEPNFYERKHNRMIRYQIIQQQVRFLRAPCPYPNQSKNDIEKIQDNNSLYDSVQPDQLLRSCNGRMGAEFCYF